MRNRLFIGSMALLSAVLGFGQAARPLQQSATQTPAPAAAATQRALLDQYCVTCHNNKTKRANLTLEKLDLTTAGDHPELWEKVIRKLRAGVMPPPGMRRPALKEYEGLRDWLDRKSTRLNSSHVSIS